MGLEVRPVAISSPRSCPKRGPSVKPPPGAGNAVDVRIVPEPPKVGQGIRTDAFISRPTANNVELCEARDNANGEPQVVYELVVVDLLPAIRQGSDALPPAANQTAVVGDLFQRENATRMGGEFADGWWCALGH